MTIANSKLFGLFGVALLAAVAGCSKTGIGVRSDVSTQQFTAGTTTKDQVVEAIGLPQHMSKDADGTEHFWYEQDDRFNGMCIGCGQPTQAGLIPAASVAGSVAKQRANAVEIIFNPAGVLVTMNLPPPKKTAKRR